MAQFSCRPPLSNAATCTHQQGAEALQSALQVAAALVQYATFCVPGCAGPAHAALPQLANPESAADIMSATQRHAGLLLQVASDQQVSLYLDSTTVIVLPFTMTACHLLLESSKCCLKDSLIPWACTYKHSLVHSIPDVWCVELCRSVCSFVICSLPLQFARRAPAGSLPECASQFSETYCFCRMW